MPATRIVAGVGACALSEANTDDDDNDDDHGPQTTSRQVLRWRTESCPMADDDRHAVSVCGFFSCTCQQCCVRTQTMQPNDVCEVRGWVGGLHDVAQTIGKSAAWTTCKYDQAIVYVAAAGCRCRHLLTAAIACNRVKGGVLALCSTVRNVYCGASVWERFLSRHSHSFARAKVFQFS